MARKRKNPATNFKFDKSVDTGPLPEDADVSLQQTIQDERIRRQVQSRMGVKPKKRKFYTVVE